MDKYYDMQLIKFLCSGKQKEFYSSFLDNNLKISVDDFISIASQIKAIELGYTND